MQIVRFILAVLALICFGFLAWLLITGQLNFRADLSAMLPSGKLPPEVRQVEKRLQNLSARQIVLLVGAKNDDDLYDALDYLDEAIDQSDELKKVFDEARFFDQVLPLLKEQQFYLLTDEDRNLLAKGDLEFLIQRGREQLLSWDAGLVSYEDDLLGTLNGYIQQVAGNAAGDDSFEASWNQQSYRFKPVLLQTQLSAMNLESQQQLTTQLLALKNTLQSDFDVIVLTTGVVFFSHYAAETAKSEINLIAGLSSFGIIVLCLFVFQSLRPLFFALTSIAFGVAGAFAICHWYFGGLNILTMVFGSALIGVAVDFCIHYCYGASQHGHQSLNKVFAPMMLSLASSVLGYGALVMAGLAGLVEIAVFSVLGLAIACTYVLVVGPYHLGGKPFAAKTIKSLPLLLSRNAVIFIFPGVSLFLFLVLLEAAFSDRLTFGSGPRAFYSSSPELLSQAKFINKQMGAEENSRYLVVLAKSENELLQKLDKELAIVDQWQAEGIIGGYDSIRRWVPSASEQVDNHGLFSNVLKENAKAKFEAAGIKQTAIGSYFDRFFSSENIVLNAGEFAKVLGEQGQWYWQHLPSAEAAVIRLKNILDISPIKNYTDENDGLVWVDSVENIHTGLNTLQRKALGYLLLSYVFILVLLSIFVRFGNAVMVVSLPLLSSLLAVSLLGFIGHAISLFHCLALYLVLGLGIDYGVFMLSSDVRRSTYSGVLVSSLTTVLAFGLLVLSSTPFIREFGLMVMLGCIFNVLLSMLIAPASAYEKAKSLYF